MLNSKYLFGIFVVLALATVGWFILGGTLVARTAQSDMAQREALAGLWGSPLEQVQPDFSFQPRAAGAPRPAVLPSSSRIAVDLALDLRRKGLLWYDTYGIVKHISSAPRRRPTTT